MEAKGRMKEAVRPVTGERRRRPRAEPSRGRAKQARRPPRGRTRRTEKESKEAHREHDKRRCKDTGGPLGNLGDTLSGR
jgi:hypothetical protein